MHVRVNGQLIEVDYETTGDSARDLELVHELLVEQGHLTSATAARRIFSQAAAFTRASQALYREALANPNEGGLYPMVPFVVNCAFAAELFLKLALTFAAVEYPRKHTLLELYDLIPAGDQAEIAEHARVYLGARAKLDPETSLRELLEGIDSAFVKWRYLHEEGSAAPVYFEEVTSALSILWEAMRQRLLKDEPRGDS